MVQIELEQRALNKSTAGENDANSSVIGLALSPNNYKPLIDESSADPTSDAYGREAYEREGGHGNEHGQAKRVVPSGGCQLFVKSKGFSYLSLTFLLCNVVVMCMPFEGQSDEYAAFTESLATVFTFLFTVELVFRLCGYGTPGNLAVAQ